MSDTQKQLIAALVLAISQQAPAKKPTVDELAQWANLDKVSGADRDAAWTEYQASLNTDSQSDNDNDNDNEPEEIEGYYVRTAPGTKSFRRAGYAFNERGTGFAKGVLSEEQLKALKAEKRLIVEESTFMDNAPNVVTKKAE